MVILLIRHCTLPLIKNNKHSYRILIYSYTCICITYVGSCKAYFHVFGENRKIASILSSVKEIPIDTGLEFGIPNNKMLSLTLCCRTCHLEWSRKSCNIGPQPAFWRNKFDDTGKDSPTMCERKQMLICGIQTIRYSCQVQWNYTFGSGRWLGIWHHIHILWYFLCYTRYV